MTIQEVTQQIAMKLGPVMEELGVESFLLAGYVRDGDGKVSRVTMGGNSKTNAACNDGLRNLHELANRWGAGQL